MKETTISTIEKPTFTYHYVQLAPAEQIGLHQDFSWEVSYVITGAGVRLVGDNTEPFSSGEVVLIPPEIPHCWYFDKEVTDKQGRIANITVSFTPDFLYNLERAFPSLAESIGCLRERKDAVVFDRLRAARIAKILLSMRHLPPARRAAPMIELLLAIAHAGEERVVGRYRKADRDSDRLNQIKIYVVCNSQRNISLDEVARYAGMNRSAFCVFFKRATGTTFVNYLNEYRVEQACKLLERQCSMTVSEVCYRAGFNDMPYFCRVFKRLKGVSPLQYRGLSGQSADKGQM